MSYFIRAIGIGIMVLGVIGFFVFIAEAQPGSSYGQVNSLLVGYAIAVGALGVAIGSMWYYFGKLGATIERVAEEILEEEE